MLATAGGLLVGSALGTAAGHIVADVWDGNSIEEGLQEEVQQQEEEVTILSVEDIVNDEVYIGPEVEPVAVVYGGPPVTENPGDIMEIDIEPDMYGGPDMYDPGFEVDIDQPSLI